MEQSITERYPFFRNVFQDLFNALPSLHASQENASRKTVSFGLTGYILWALKIILATLNIHVKLTFSYVATYLCISELCLFVLDKSVTVEGYCLQHMLLNDTFTAAAFTSTACSLLFGKVPVLLYSSEYFLS